MLSQFKITRLKKIVPCYVFGPYKSITTVLTIVKQSFRG
jgi:hypothetical protein